MPKNNDVFSNQAGEVAAGRSVHDKYHSKVAEPFFKAQRTEGIDCSKHPAACGSIMPCCSLYFLRQLMSAICTAALIAAVALSGSAAPLLL